MPVQLTPPPLCVPHDPPQYFLLFLFYTALSSITGCALLLPEFLAFFTSGEEAQEEYGGM